MIYPATTVRHPVFITMITVMVNMTAQPGKTSLVAKVCVISFSFKLLSRIQFSKHGSTRILISGVQYHVFILVPLGIRSEKRTNSDNYDVCTEEQGSNV